MLKKYLKKRRDKKVESFINSFINMKKILLYIRNFFVRIKYRFEINKQIKELYNKDIENNSAYAKSFDNLVKGQSDWSEGEIDLENIRKAALELTEKSPSIEKQALIVILEGKNYKVVTVGEDTLMRALDIVESIGNKPEFHSNLHLPLSEFNEEAFRKEMMKYIYNTPIKVK